jgi:hypothetical protein
LKTRCKSRSEMLLYWGASLCASVAMHSYPRSTKQLPQLRILRLSLLQDGDVRVGVFPEGEEILIGGFCLGSAAFHGVGTGETEMC